MSEKLSISPFIIQFYVYGLMLCIVVSYLGAWVSGALLAHSSGESSAPTAILPYLISPIVTLLLLFPLAVRHGLLKQLANQNWALVWNSGVVLIRNLCQSLLNTLSQLLANIRVLLARNRSTTNTTHQPQATTTQ